MYAAGEGFRHSMTKILALSDMHGILPVLDTTQIDIILIAGDICPTRDHSANYQKKWLDVAFYDWCKKLNVPVYLTLGNHDFIDKFDAPKNLHYGTASVINDIMLFSYTPPFFNWAWMAPEPQIKSRLEQLLQEHNPAIWLCHGAPYGICDEVDGKSCGSISLREAILEHQPEWVICGHLHEGKPYGELGKTKIHNVSVLNDKYIRYREPTVIEAGN